MKRRSFLGLAAGATAALFIPAERLEFGVPKRRLVLPPVLDTLPGVGWRRANEHTGVYIAKPPEVVIDRFAKVTAEEGHLHVGAYNDEWNPTNLSLTEASPEAPRLADFYRAIYEDARQAEIERLSRLWSEFWREEERKAVHEPLPLTLDLLREIIG